MGVEALKGTVHGSREEGNVVSDVVYPIVVIDDDNWLDIYSSEQVALDSFEAPFVDEVRVAFDSRGNQVVVSVNKDEVHISATERSDVVAISSAVQDFFRVWTTSPPPALTNDSRSYVASVIDAVRCASVRRRRAR